MRKREAGALRLAGQRYRDNGAGAFVEYVVTENQHWTQAGVFVAAHRIAISSANLATQYSGHVSRSPLKPSSASAFSNFGSSFAHSEARRLRASRASFSETANWIARLRLGKTLFEIGRAHV